MLITDPQGQFQAVKILGTLVNVHGFFLSV